MTPTADEPRSPGSAAGLGSARDFRKPPLRLTWFLDVVHPPRPYKTPSDLRLFRRLRRLLPTGALDFPSRFRDIRHLISTPCWRPALDLPARGAYRAATPQTPPIPPRDQSEPCRNLGADAAACNRELSSRRLRGVDPDRSSPYQPSSGLAGSLPCRCAGVARAQGPAPAPLATRGVDTAAGERDIAWSH